MEEEVKVDAEVIETSAPVEETVETPVEETPAESETA